MPKGSPTTIFVSSTCYDLGQVRADLREFAISLGYEPVLSELDSFPVSPSADTLQNCLAAVRDRADLFVLIVGGRYGSLSKTGLSITNLEYLEATAKGIPVFVFVRSDIITLLPTWEANPSANFSHAVDSTQLFEFVDALRSQGSNWVFPFSTVQDITSALRKQISFLMSECLELRSRMLPSDPTILALGVDSLRCYIEKRAGWEYLTLAHSVREQVLRHGTRLMDLRLGVSFGPIVQIRSLAEARDWLLTKFAEIRHIASQMSAALQNGVEPAVGPPGQPGSLRHIVHLATRFADGYAASIDWTLEFYRVDADPELNNLIRLGSNLSSNIIEEMREFAESLPDRIETVLRDHPKDGQVDFVLKLTMPDLHEFQVEMARLNTLYG
jgi:hypothetical protein